MLPPGEFPVNSPRSRPGRLGVCFHIWLLLFLPQGRRQPPQHTFIHAQVRNTGVIPQIVLVCKCRLVLIGSWLVIWDLAKVRPTQQNIDLQSVTDSTADSENEIRGALDEGVPMSVTHHVNVKKWPCQDTCIRPSCQDTCIGQP